MWLAFDCPETVLVADRLDQVRPVLRQAALAAERGQMAVGFVAYEAASAFDPAMRTHAPTDHPLAWFAVFPASRVLEDLADISPSSGPLSWQPSISRATYEESVEAIRRHIARGDTYQINFTLRLTAPFDDDPFAFFTSLCRGQRSQYCAYIDTGDLILCSASPELFFEIERGRIRCKPMKGTAARGRTVEEDLLQEAWLRGSQKNRAENVMIVDMVRNDLGRIAVPGSVRVSHLCELEKYPSLFQLTSTVEADTEVNLDSVFAALFPSASITGAPKIRAMEIISRLEGAPRGVYTGAIGLMGPGHRARFNVAIRTAEIDPARSLVIYGTGGGIVWDSIASEEWQEARTKALVLEPRPARFELLETLLWEPRTGYYLLSRHLNRMQSSARYFDVPFAARRVDRTLEEHASSLPSAPHRVRLLVDGSGQLQIESELLPVQPRRWRVTIADAPIDSRDPFLFHKTTHRHVYERHRQAHPGYDDVLLWNERREVTEATLANVVVRVGDRKITPPLEAGLLAGTFRAELLEQREIIEDRIELQDLATADEAWLINSVRRWIEIALELPKDCDSG